MYYPCFLNYCIGIQTIKGLQSILYIISVKVLTKNCGIYTWPILSFITCNIHSYISIPHFDILMSRWFEYYFSLSPL